MSFEPSAVRYDRFHAEFSAERPIQYRGDMMNEFAITPSASGKKLTIDLKAPRYVNYTDEPENGYIRRYPRLYLGSSLDMQENLGPLAKRYNEILAAALPGRSAAAVSKAKSLPAQAACHCADAVHTTKFPLSGRLAHERTRPRTVLAR